MRTIPDDPSGRRQHRLELQARAVESVLARHGLLGKVREGVAGPDSCLFLTELPQDIGHLPVRALERRLREALRAVSVHIELTGGFLHVIVNVGKAPRVDLLDLLSRADRCPPGAIALGRTEDGRPLFLNLFRPHPVHLLILGDAAAGKSSLLRSLSLSLALTHGQSDLQLAIIDPAGADLRPLHYLPHAVSDVACSPGEIRQLLHFLRREMAFRLESGISRPAIVVALDDLSQLLADGGPSCERLVGDLLRPGARAGLHLLLAASDLPSREMSHALRAHVATHLLGRQSDAHSVLTSGCATRTSCLRGRGDFLAVTGGAHTRFQAAFVDDYDLHLCLERLHRSRRPPLLARPFDPRPRLEPAQEPAWSRRPFSFDGERISFPGE